MSDEIKPIRRQQSPVAIAAVASVLGMATCTKTWFFANTYQGTTPATGIWHSQSTWLVRFFGPFLLGGIVCAIAYRVIARATAVTVADTSIDFDETPAPREGAKHLRRRDGTDAAGSGWVVLFSILALSAVLGALFFWFADTEGFGGSAPTDRSFGDSLSNLVDGAFVGACFGFLIAAPAAIIVAMSARRRDD